MNRSLTANLDNKSIEELKATIQEKTNPDNNSNTNVVEHSLAELVTNMLLEMGISANLKGYSYLREAILLKCKIPTMKITNEMYPAIAEKFGSTARNVDRAIRHSIKVAWDSGKIENLNTTLGFNILSNNQKLSNSQLICLISDKIVIANT